MTEPGFERTFRAWARENGVGWEALRYARPGVPGETAALRLSPAGPPRGVVLAVHGAGNDSLFGWVGLFKRLLAEGLEIFSFDVEGHGRSSTTRFDPAACGGAVAEAARRSGAAERGLPLHGVGISLGGALLLHALPSLPGVASAVLMVTPLRVDFSWRAVRGELSRPLLRALARGRGDYGLTGLIPSFGPFKRGTYPLRLAVPPGEGAFGYVEVLNAALAGLRLEEAARAVRVPVLLVYGGRDRLVPPEQGERLARLLPRAELLRLPDETHLSAPLAPEAVERAAMWMGEARGNRQQAAAGPLLPVAREEADGREGLPVAREEEGRGGP